MADRKISDLTALTTPAAGDYLPIVDISEASAANKNKRITIEELLRGAPDGTAAAPSIGFESDPNTGIYRPGADQVAISTNGTGRLFVDSAGNVGIGTASPGSALEINAAAATSPFIAKINTAEAARIDSSGRLLVGTSSARGNFYNSTNTANILLEGTTSSNSTIAAVSNRGIADPNNEPTFVLGRSGSDSIASNTLVAADNAIGRLSFQGNDGTEFVELAHIRAFVDGTPGANDMPGRLVFSTTADGASSPTERLRITSAGVLQVADAGNITVGTTTGTKIGTATTQKLGFYNATPVVQPAAVADATDAATVITQLNDLLAKLRTLGIIAT